MKISGFSFIHNAIDSGYPIIEAIWAISDYVDEVVVVDMQSTDETREVLERLGVRIIDGEWGNEAGKTLKVAHALHSECTYDIILHFEADEVFDETLIDEVGFRIDSGHNQIGVYRLQLEQNFQRCRWYPQMVHRVFKKGTVVKEGHSTDHHLSKSGLVNIVKSEFGYLWDCTNIFRDSWKRRIQKQAELWHNSKIEWRRTPIHFLHSHIEPNIDMFLQCEHWTEKCTPFCIPKILEHLVGVVDYRHSDTYKGLMKQ